MHRDVVLGEVVLQILLINLIIIPLPNSDSVLNDKILFSVVLWFPVTT
jgi:hypothetical protein